VEGDGLQAKATNGWREPVVLVDRVDGNGEEMNGETDSAVKRHGWTTALLRLDKKDLEGFGEILDNRPGGRGAWAAGRRLCSWRKNCSRYDRATGSL
jgi:hypothetical protein